MPKDLFKEVIRSSGFHGDCCSAACSSRSRTIASAASPSLLAFGPTADRSDEVRAPQESRSYVTKPQNTRRKKNPLATGLGTQPGSGELTGCRTQALHAHRAELFRDIQRNIDECEHLKDASDRNGWLRLAANRTSSASLNDAMADIYEELLTAEPALADEHRASAEQHREFAHEARGYADLALEEAGKL